MGDPTFTHQFGMAVQADILRQAAIDRQNWHAWQQGHRRGSIGLLRLARYLTSPFRLVGRHGRDSAQCRPS